MTHILAPTVKGWAFDEARRLIAHCNSKTPDKGYVLFETGYGPSGLPHLGTFGEVVRTAMVRHAFECLTDGAIPTRLICFSDDLDGLRKVPDNVPNPHVLEAHLGQPLSSIPDPYGEAESFAAGNNHKLCRFLDSFGFSYEFMSAAHCYQTGIFDDLLLKSLEHYEAIMDIMLPTLGTERQQTYSPFLPISPTTGAVLQTPILDRDLASGCITFEDEDGTYVTQPVTRGHAKLQWKPDWAMRWCALGVDYEMHGKDLISSSDVGQAICRALGYRPPLNFSYELFLDSEGHKISKSKGNGLSLEEWLTYGPAESLAYYLSLPPRKARRLHFDVIPKAVDDMIAHARSLRELEKQPEVQHVDRLQNSAYLVKAVLPHSTLMSPDVDMPSYSMLLNLAAAAKTESSAVMWGFIHAYTPDLTAESCPMLDNLVGYALSYVHDKVLPTLSFRVPDPYETKALTDLKNRLEAAPAELTPEEAQQLVFDVGKHWEFDPIRSWFSTLYTTLLGQANGPRMGTFISLYGRDKTIKLIAAAVARLDT